MKSKKILRLGFASLFLIFLINGLPFIASAFNDINDSSSWLSKCTKILLNWNPNNTSELTNPSTKITLDLSSNKGSVERNASACVKLALVIAGHNWEYSYESSGQSVIVFAKCIEETHSNNSCNAETYTLTLSVSSPIYSGEIDYLNIGTLEERKNWESVGLSLPTKIDYYRGTEKLAQLPLVSGNYTAIIYVDSRAVSIDFTILPGQSEIDQKAANEVIEKINAIGPILLNDECKALIDDARNSYENLTELQKKLVTNYNILCSSEKQYNELMYAANSEVCENEGHEFTYNGTMIICKKCYNSPDVSDFSGFVTDSLSGKPMYICNGEVQTGLVLIEDGEYIFDQNGLAIDGEYTIDRMDYILKNGKVVNKNGFEEIYSSVKNTRYLHLYENGNLVEYTGWIVYQDNWYYIDSSNVCYTHKSLSGVVYYFNYDGSHTKGTFKDNRKGIKYFFAGSAAKGLQTIENEVYYFNPANGYMVKNKSIEIDNLIYTFGDDGKAISIVEKPYTGFKTENGKTYYLCDGTMVKGWNDINGTWYYFMPDSGYMLTSPRTIDGVFYKFNSDGTHTEGTFKTNAKGTRYYFAGKYAVGIYNINGLSYYFDKNGFLCRDFIFTIENTKYTTDENGIIIKAELNNPKPSTGFWSEGEKTYYYIDDVIVVNDWVTTETGIFYFGANGIMVTTSKSIDGVYYKFNSDGTHTEGTFKTNNKGTRYFFAGSAVTGLQTINGNLYYFNPSSYMIKNAVKTIDGVTYSFDENGVGSVLGKNSESTNYAPQIYEN